MSNSMNDRVAADFQAMKAEGKQRAAKIRDVMRPAMTETASEVKAGSVAIWTIAKSLVAAVVTMLRETVIPEKMATVDDQLHEKYGDRYQSMKQRVRDLKTQYDNRTKPES
jgi:predicted RecB family endonuclease